MPINKTPFAKTISGKEQWQTEAKTDI